MAELYKYYNCQQTFVKFTALYLLSIPCVQVRKTSMARIICDNTDELDSIQPLAFKLPTSKANAVRSCTEDSIPRLNLQVFRQSSNFGR